MQYRKRHRPPRARRRAASVPTQPPSTTTSPACRRASSRALEALDGERFRRRRVAAPRRRRRHHAHPRGRQASSSARGVEFLARARATQLPPSATRARARSSPAAPCEAMGVSLVLHPRNPYCPTVHMNVRFFVAHGDDRLVVRRRHGPHAVLRLRGGRAPLPCAPAATRSRPSAPTTIARFKRWCDEYFYLKHRNEPRGIGGIFFDDLARARLRPCFALMQRGRRRISSPAYVPIVERRAATALRRARARLPGLPARPLRRVQPRLRPRHAVRPAVGRPHRVDPDVAAAARARGATTGSRSRARRRKKLYSDFLVPRDWL